jgi:hypothetical protein
VARRIRIHAHFQVDLRGHLSWLTEHRDGVGIESLRTGIDEALELVSQLPHVGTIEARQGAAVMRRLILRRVPYVVWFARDTSKPGSTIWFMRLFHARQERPPAEAAVRRRRAVAR